MKTYNLLYKNDKELEDFISLYKFIDEKNILIQIFSGVVDENVALELSSFIQKKLPLSNIIGTTTAGEISHGKMYEQNIVISFLVLNSSTIKSQLIDFELDNNIDETLHSLIDSKTKAMILFSDGLQSNAEDLIKKITDIKEDLVIAGGRAADAIKFDKTFVFDENKSTQNGCVIALISGDELIVNNDYLLNWNPIGKEFVVTKSSKNNLIELDYMPIVKVYKKYLGDDISDNLPLSGSEFPLLIKKDGYFVARAPIAKLEDGSLLFGGDINEGDILQFSFGNIDSIKGDVKNNFKKFKNTPSEAIFIYSCSARKTLIGDELEVEFSFLESLAPTSGFFTYGEYFHSQKHNELLNVTTTFLSLSESPIVETKELKEELKTKTDNRILTALSHLSNVTSQELQDTYSILNKAQKIAKLGSWELDLINNNLWWSDEIYNIFQLDKNKFDVTYEEFLEHIDPADRDIVNKAFEISLKDKNIPYYVEYRLLLKDGNKKVVREQAEILRDNDDTPIKMTGTVQDITLEYQVQETLKKQKENLLKAKKKANNANKAKSEFLANMSHEIRTPLNAVVGFVELLKDESSGKSLEYVNIIDESSKNLLKIIEDILDFSKIESGKLSIDKIDFDTKNEFRTITHLFDAKCSSKDITLNLDIDKNLPQVINSDPLRLKQILINLISNAIKFTPNGKNIFIRISYENNSLFVSVKDEGTGIAKNKQKDIFEAFVQENSSTTREFGGTGLGLSISSKLTQLLGGELKVKSKLAVGSEFYFTIPVAVGDRVEKIESKTKNITFKDKKILLAEDNITNQMFMKVVLKKLDLNYDIASDGLEAVEMFKKEKYDAIIMDENMPNMNGIEATAIIVEFEKNNNLLHTPIIALTANALKGDRERFLEAGMDEYLTKPLDKEKLIYVLNSFI